MEVVVTTLGGESVAIEVSISELLSDLKDKVCNSCKIEQGHLLLGSVPLVGDDKTLGELGVNQGACIHVVRCGERDDSGRSVPIYVRCTDGPSGLAGVTIYTVDIALKETVKNLKEKLRGRFNGRYAPENFQLTFDGFPLEDFYRLDESWIEACSSVSLTFLSPPNLNETSEAHSTNSDEASDAHLSDVAQKGLANLDEASQSTGSVGSHEFLDEEDTLGLSILLRDDFAVLGGSSNVLVHH